MKMKTETKAKMEAGMSKRDAISFTFAIVMLMNIVLVEAIWIVVIFLANFASSN